MTAFTSKIGETKLKQWIVLVAIAFCSNGLFAQLDSASVSLSLTNEVDPLDSTAMVDVLHVDVYLNDTDFFGELVVTIYQTGTDYPLMMQKFTKQEALDSAMLSGNQLDVPFYEVDSAGSYRVETQVRNYQGANLPMIISNYNN